MLSFLLAILKKMSLTQWLITAGLVIILGLTMALKVEHGRLLTAQSKERTAQIATLNIAAKFDTVIKISHDSIAALQIDRDLYKQRVAQEKQKTSTLYKQLGELTVANYKLTLHIDTLTARVGATVTDTQDSLRAVFNVNQPPYHAVANVALPKLITPVSQGRLSLSVTQDPLGLGVHVGCSTKAMNNGVRVAFLDVTAPHYATVRLDSLTQAEDVCSPKPAALINAAPSFLSRVWSIMKYAGVGVGFYFIGRGSK